MRTMLLTMGAVLASTSARADQCQLNAPPIAARAAAIVRPGATVLEYCEPCRDRAPGKPYQVATVDVRNGEVVLDGKGVDLAYLFVKTPSGDFQNVGVAAGCGPSDVSEWIKNGTPTGPTRRVRPPMTPPPPPPRATGPDDLGGIWDVRITTKFSSCPGVVPGVQLARWTITTINDTVELELPDGRYTGTVESPGQTTFKTTLQSKLHPSGTGLQLSMFFKESFYGTLVRGQVLGGGARDPVCVIYQDVSARRHP